MATGNTTCADAAQHPGNYYVQQGTGAIQQSSGLLAKVLTNWLGYADPFDWCDAKAYAAAHTESGLIHSPGKVVGALAGETGNGLGLSGLGFHSPSAGTFLNRARRSRSAASCSSSASSR